MMNPVKRNILCMGKVMLLLLLMVATAELTKRTVPQPYATIQAAIDAATPGDTVRVYHGTYTGPVNINKSLVVIGS